jgi:hypothetical protein
MEREPIASDKTEWGAGAVRCSDLFGGTNHLLECFISCWIGKQQEQARNNAYHDENYPFVTRTILRVRSYDNCVYCVPNKQEAPSYQHRTEQV